MTHDRARIISPSEWGPELDVIKGEGRCLEIVGPRVSAVTRSLYWFDLPEGSATITLKHPDEAVYYIVSGSVRVESTSGPAITLPEGGMLHVRPATDYTIVADTATTFFGGPSPVDPEFGVPAESRNFDDVEGPREIRGYHRDEPGVMVPFISDDARLVVWYGEGAVNANMNYVVMEPGERNKEHLHRYSEDTILILEGHGTAEDVTNGNKLTFGPLDVVHIPPGIIHAVAADKGERVISAGGPCPADLDMLRVAGLDVDAITAELGLS